MKLLPNTVEGLRWGLENFDGVEFDIRLTADDKLVIHHDPVTSAGNVIRERTQEELSDGGLPKLEEFFQDRKIQQSIRDGKTLFIELKPDCIGGKLTVEGLGVRFRKAFDTVFNSTGLPSEEIRFLSFQKRLLDSFSDSYKTYPILPEVDECKTYSSDLKMLLAYLPKVVGKSLKKHLKEAGERGYAGVFFARQYLFGPTKVFHPSYKKLVKLSREMGLDVGTNLGDYTLEPSYPALFRFSDQTSVYPRHAGKGEGKIIAHRGTGTKGVEIP